MSTRRGEGFGPNPTDPNWKRVNTPTQKRGEIREVLPQEEQKPPADGWDREDIRPIDTSGIINMPPKKPTQK